MKKENNLMNQRIYLYFTKEEKEKIKKIAEANHMTISNYCRKKIEERTTATPIDFQKIYELLYNIQWVCEGFTGDDQRKEKLESQLEEIKRVLEEIQ